MNYEAGKRPKMRFIFELMQKLNSVINKKPIQALKDNSELERNDTMLIFLNF